MELASAPWWFWVLCWQVGCVITLAVMWAIDSENERFGLTVALLWPLALPLALLIMICQVLYERFDRWLGV